MTETPTTIKCALSFPLQQMDKLRPLQIPNFISSVSSVISVANGV